MGPNTVFTKSCGYENWYDTHCDL